MYVTTCTLFLLVVVLFCSDYCKVCRVRCYDDLPTYLPTTTTLRYIQRERERETSGGHYTKDTCVSLCLILPVCVDNKVCNIVHKVNREREREREREGYKEALEG